MNKKTKLRGFSLAPGILLFCIAAGCSHGSDPEAMLADYVARVENITEVEVLDFGSYRGKLLVYPDRRDRRLDLTDVRVGFDEFLALYECGLQAIVGERNSSLGRVMPVSRQLVYEHRLLVGARRCRRQLESKGPEGASLLATLEQVVEIKSADLPRSYWNATFGSPEFEHMFSLAASPLQTDAATGSAGKIEVALRHLADLGSRLGDESLVIDSSELEAHYQALNSRRMAGEVLRAVDLLRFYLRAAAQAIEKRLATRPICFGQRPTPKARVYDNVLRKYYIGKVQPYLAKVHRQARGWLGSLNRIADAQTEHMTPAFTAYFDRQLSMVADEALWPRYQRALARHTEAWQRVLSQCGLMP